jgi:uncharacterized membrane protein
MTADTLAWIFNAIAIIAVCVTIYYIQKTKRELRRAQKAQDALKLILEKSSDRRREQPK